MNEVTQFIYFFPNNHSKPKTSVFGPVLCYVLGAKGEIMDAAWAKGSLVRKRLWISDWNATPKGCRVYILGTHFTW